MSGSGDAHLLADAGGFQYDKPERSSSLSRADEDDNGKANSRSSGSTSDSDSPLFPLNRREAATSTCAPIGAVAVSDEGEDSASGVPVARVSGCVDVCTLGELYPWRNLYGLTPRGEQVRLGFVRQQVSALRLDKCAITNTWRCLPQLRLLFYSYAAHTCYPQYLGMTCLGRPSRLNTLRPRALLADDFFSLGTSVGSRGTFMAFGRAQCIAQICFLGQFTGATTHCHHGADLGVVYRLSTRCVSCYSLPSRPLKICRKRELRRR